MVDKSDIYIKDLLEFLRIPTVSTDSAYKEGIVKGAGWLAEELKKSGMENVEIMETAGNPVVYADWLHQPGKPTFLIYGHYDVQPPDPLGLWTTSPFEPEIRDDKVYARGATDDKGQLLIHVKAVASLMEEYGELPVNVKFCLEGEEEIASPNLVPFVKKHKEKLSCDAVLVSDTPMMDKETPAIVTGLRGALAFEMNVITASSDLHSGAYGGAVPNAVHHLVKLLDSLHDDEGKITVDGFYEGVPEVTNALREEMARLPFSEEETKRELGLSSLYGEKGYTPLEQIGIRPTMEFNGIKGGYQGEGMKTIIPKEASAKISCRLVGEQHPSYVFERIREHVAAFTPEGATVTLDKLIEAKAVTMDPDNEYIQKAARAYENFYENETLFPKEGGSIPIIEVFRGELDSEPVLMGFGLQSENMHAPDEHFNLSNFRRGIKTVKNYFESF
ncbi:dipeptidase [Salimicrobium flavidum]|uniref:Acetylornithine deacetylase/Succinyl-diaminopimelate desuccinylase n=1 Tax=Salimicrobium flavidum TaxID=570947 RepID=A0A1N7ISQ2_9BACI|nr:dipeptidase [Salimicrobium flavidum]SIS40113.1 Acetylornithine deacetylase/Succinyl-diaminopimelate desuccinylase [Salimicrobium flavidum]